MAVPEENACAIQFSLLVERKWRVTLQSFFDLDPTGEKIFNQTGQLEDNSFDVWAGVFCIIVGEFGRISVLDI